jgi:hypothetical protein
VQSAQDARASQVTAGASAVELPRSLYSQQLEHDPVHVVQSADKHVPWMSPGMHFPLLCDQPQPEVATQSAGDTRSSHTSDGGTRPSRWGMSNETQQLPHLPAQILDRDSILHESAASPGVHTPVTWFQPHPAALTQSAGVKRSLHWPEGGTRLNLFGVSLPT